MKGLTSLLILTLTLLCCSLPSQAASLALVRVNTTPVIDTIRDTLFVNVCQGRVYHSTDFSLTTNETSVDPGAVIVRHRIDSIGPELIRRRTLMATVNVTPVVSLQGNRSICQGGYGLLRCSGGVSYVWSTGSNADSTLVDHGGQYWVKCINEVGCYDSSAFTITVNQPLIHEVTAHVCVGDSIEFQGVYYHESGRHTQWLKNAAMCDSLEVLYIEVEPLPNVKITGDVEYCQGRNATLVANGAVNYRWQDGERGNTYTLRNSGNYYVVGSSIYGCEATDSVTVHRRPSYEVRDTATICNGKVFEFYRHELRTAGLYTHTTTTIYGCDSVINLRLIVNPVNDTSIHVYTTNSYRWNDSTYRDWGTYTHHYVNRFGCDSVVTLHLGLVWDAPVPQIVSYQNRLLLLDHYPGGSDSARVDYLGYQWYVNGNAIEGAYEDEFRRVGYPTLKGCFRLMVKVDSIHWVPSNVICIDYEYTYNAIDDLNQVARISVAPNPVKAGSMLSLSLDDVMMQGDAHVEVVDMQGRVVTRQSARSALHAPDATGFYSLRIVDAMGLRAMAKIIVY